MQQRLPLAGPAGLTALPAWSWLALQAAALWPHAAWAAARMRDGSDDPMGLAALAMLALLLLRSGLRDAPRAGWLGASLALTAGATAALWTLPPLAAGVIAAAALGTALAAWLPDDAPRLAPAGLVLLALPLLASLQFYAGYPLRLLTAQLSAGLLQLAAVDAVASGAAMTVQGRLVIVDAPCSGVQMAWLGYFCALAAAGWLGLRDGALLKRLPLVGVIVLGGNVLRNSLLVALESRPQGLAEGTHAAIGFLVLSGVCAAVLCWTTREAGDAHRD
ncbi:exosortase Q [uncultured Methylibium sp.]|uniref:exosortase Q n=1 Tax=uncultured Methylibium sp. TaxID=381093 RepID=UPI0025DD3AB4|nr:exosortase Q [uncultured Methylibium sp.]